jgi:hypothetical protein
MCFIFELVNVVERDMCVVNVNNIIKCNSSYVKETSFMQGPVRSVVNMQCTIGRRKFGAR